VEVTDTGTGIPSEIQAQIFEPFFTTRDRGSGLGLSTSYGIVKEHGGELLFESEEGRGAVFTVLLPLHREAPEDAGERDTPARIDARGRVLLADDEPALLRVLSRALRKAGFDVIEAVNGEEARAVFARERGRIDAAVLDAVMPRGDGPSVARAIRSSGRAVPVVIMSGYVASALDSIEPVCDRFLAKPCDPKLLVSTLQELMNESASR
jgi:two-component system cell cycle sensor histidine kinase/response regulator CckA